MIIIEDFSFNALSLSAFYFEDIILQKFDKINSIDSLGIFQFHLGSQSVTILADTCTIHCTATAYESKDGTYNFDVKNITVDKRKSR